MPGVVGLTPGTPLVGHDGRAVGWFGDDERSEVLLDDDRPIEGFGGLDRRGRLLGLNAQGHEAAAHSRAVLPEAVVRFRRPIALTHVPPSREAYWHRGPISDDGRLPHFACRAVGEAPVETMAAHPGCDMMVLCGHTHSSGEA